MDETTMSPFVSQLLPRVDLFVCLHKCICTYVLSIILSLSHPVAYFPITFPDPMIPR